MSAKTKTEIEAVAASLSGYIDYQSENLPSSLIDDAGLKALGFSSSLIGRGIPIAVGVAEVTEQVKDKNYGKAVTIAASTATGITIGEIATKYAVSWGAKTLVAGTILDPLGGEAAGAVGFVAGGVAGFAIGAAASWGVGKIGDYLLGVDYVDSDPIQSVPAGYGSGLVPAETAEAETGNPGLVAVRNEYNAPDELSDPNSPSYSTVSHVVNSSSLDVALASQTSKSLSYGGDSQYSSQDLQGHSTAAFGYDEVNAPSNVPDANPGDYSVGVSVSQDEDLSGGYTAMGDYTGVGDDNNSSETAASQDDAFSGGYSLGTSVSSAPDDDPSSEAGGLSSSGGSGMGGSESDPGGGWGADGVGSDAEDGGGGADSGQAGESEGGENSEGSENPVILDLKGTGINITKLSSSNVYEDTTGSGYKSRTAWAGAGSAVLFVDPTGSNTITQTNQYVFTDWDPTASSDMQALKDVFDTNHDGKLDAGDTAFSEFRLMVTNADGTTTVETLAQAGITSIDLTENDNAQTLSDGTMIEGETTYTTTSGSTGTAATVDLASSGSEDAITTTTTTNASTGAVTVDNKVLNPDGSLASSIICSPPSQKSHQTQCAKGERCLKHLPVASRERSGPKGTPSQDIRTPRSVRPSFCHPHQPDKTGSAAGTDTEK